MFNLKKCKVMNKLEEINQLVNYERTMMPKEGEFPVDKIVQFFGTQTVCKAYGLAKGNLTIARELVLMEFMSRS